MGTFLKNHIARSMVGIQGPGTVVCAESVVDRLNRPLMHYAMDGASVESCPCGNEMTRDNILFALAIEVWRWATN